MSAGGRCEARIAPDLPLDYVTRRGRQRLVFGLSYLVAACACAVIQSDVGVVYA